MKAERIHYETTIPIAPYQNDKVGMDILLEVGDTPEEALSLARATVLGWHQSTVARPTLPAYPSAAIKSVEEVADPAYEECEKLVWSAPTVENALDIMKEMGYYYHQDLRKIAQSKLK